MCFKLPKIKSHKYLSMRCVSKYLDILFYWNYLVHWLYMIIYYSFHRSNFSTTTLCRTGRLYVLGEFLVGYLIVYKLVKEFGMVFIFIKLIQSQMTKNTVLRILKSKCLVSLQFKTYLHSLHYNYIYTIITCDTFVYIQNHIHHSCFTQTFKLA